MKMLRKMLWVVAATVLLWSCTDDGENESTGTLSVKLTDAPFPTEIVAEANVTIDKIEVRKSDAADSDSSSFVVLSTDTMEFNLLDLTNGVTASLAELEIEAGFYDLLRLYVSEASVVLTDGTVYDLKVPSGSQTGIKVFISPSIEVAGGLTSELLLDFDVSKSFVIQGNMNTSAGIKGFLFKPTIKASNLSTSGTLFGMVTDSLSEPIDGATVAIYAADTVYTSTLTDETGGYTILGVEAGTYEVTADYDTYSTATVGDVVITAANQTEQDIQLTE